MKNTIKTISLIILIPSAVIAAVVVGIVVWNKKHPIVKESVVADEVFEEAAPSDGGER